MLPSQQAVRVDPDYPLPSPSSKSQSASKSPYLDKTMNTENSLGRTTSRKRRVSGYGNYRGTDQFPRSDALPPAPDAPRAPPVPPASYRSPYDNGPTSPHTTTSSKSFAARVRTIPDNVDPRLANSLMIGNVPAINSNNNRHTRRGSVHKSLGNGTSQAKEQPPSATSESYSDQAWPQSAPNSAKSRNTQNKVSPPGQQKEKASESPLFSNVEPLSTRPAARRVSTGTAESPSEWASHRSPLQKLEVKLSDLSKEEKRARVQEAEQLLRESKLAKSEHKSLKEHDISPGPTISQRENVKVSETGSAKQAVPDRLGGREALNYSSVRQATRNGESDFSGPNYGNGSDQRRNVSEPATTAQMDEISQAAPYRAASHGHSRQNKQRPVDIVEPDHAVRRELNRQRNETNNQAIKLTDKNKFGIEGDDQETSVQTSPESVGPSPSKHQRFSQQQSRKRGGQENNGTSSRQVPTEQVQLYANKAESGPSHASAATYDAKEDPVPGRIAVTHEHGPKYETIPQTSSGIDARQKVGFGGKDQTHRHHFSNFLHHDRHEEQKSMISQNGPHLDEWRQGAVAHLSLADLSTNSDNKVGNKTWWEGKLGGQNQKMATRNLGAERGLEDRNATTSFNPPLYLKCGPLLRYTGIRREIIDPLTNQGNSSITERETWRGSVMIVTVDGDSSYDPVPTLRLFHQPLGPLPPPPSRVNGENGGDLPSEYIDPIAGLPKLTRTGQTVYVKPVEDLDSGVDVSMLENDDGLFEETRTAYVPTAYGKADELLGRSPLPSMGKPQNQTREGRSLGRYREIPGVRLYTERNVTFWRFNLEVELGEAQARIGYRINGAASIGFWVPGRGQTMNAMFHSCNGFSLSVNPDNFSGPDPLWRDVLNTHQTHPFHVMIGGGDQIYNDAVMRQTTLFHEWLGIKNPHHKHGAPFTWEMKDELETFYLDRYSMWFSQGLFGMANSQIPMINMWDDHDIIDGFGSYPHHFMRTPVFCGLGNVAFKYYMLFQHQSVSDETSIEEPSWLLGASPGPYINELSRSVFMSLGKHTAFLGLDCRTERMREQVLSEASYDLVFERCRKELIQGETRHLIVLLGVPIAYPRLVWLENILTSRVMDPIKALGRAGMLGGFLNQFDGGVEILDDLDDHWTAKNHKDERNWFITCLQDLAAEKSIRVTILGGDVHLAAIGQFYSNPKLHIPKDRDHRYMPNIISSAIVNTPPPEMMGDILNKRNKVHHLDHETDEDMIPMFTHDVDGKARNNKRLLPRRNWCSIREYHPGSTPAPTPPSSSAADSEVSIPQKPPNRLQRTLSLTRADSKPVNLFRRRSERGPASPEYPPSNEYYSSNTSPPARTPDSYFPTQQEAAKAGTNGATRNVSAPLPTRPINSFHRRPTNLSEKAVSKGGLTLGEINLEHGLDIVIHCEVSQKDPAGCTVPYRLLVPALWYTGDFAAHPERVYKESWLKRLRSRKATKALGARQGDGSWGNRSETASESESDKENIRYGVGRFDVPSKTLGPTQPTGQVQGPGHDSTKDATRGLPSQSESIRNDTSKLVSGGGRSMNGSEPLSMNGVVPLHNSRRLISDQGHPIGAGGSQTTQEATLDYLEPRRQVAGGQPPGSQHLLSSRSSIDQHENNPPARKLSGKLFGWGASTSPHSPTEHHEVLHKRPGGKLATKINSPNYEDQPVSQGSSLSEHSMSQSSAKKLGGKFFGWGESGNSRPSVDQHGDYNNKSKVQHIRRDSAINNANRLQPESPRSSFSDHEGRRPSTGRKLSGKFFGWGEPTTSRIPAEQPEIYQNNVKRNPTLPNNLPNNDPQHDSGSESPHSSDFSDVPPSPSAKKPAGRFFGWGEPVSSHYPSDHVDPPSSGKNPLSKLFGGGRGTTEALQSQNAPHEMGYDEDLDESPAKSRTGIFDKDGGGKSYGEQGGGSGSRRGYGGIDAYKEKDKGWRKFI